MAYIKVFEGFLKPGDAILNANFAQVLWDQNKKEYTAPCQIITQEQNLYRIGLFSGAHGTVEVSAPDFKSSRVTVVEEPFAQAKEVLLSR